MKGPKPIRETRLGYRMQKLAKDHPDSATIIRVARERLIKAQQAFGTTRDITQTATYRQALQVWRRVTGEAYVEA